MVEKTEQADKGRWLYRLIDRLAHSEGLYMVSGVMIWGAWNVIAVCAYLVLILTGVAEWVRIAVALSIVGSSFALIHILLVIIPAYLWPKRKDSKSTIEQK